MSRRSKVLTLTFLAWSAGAAFIWMTAQWDSHSKILEPILNLIFIGIYLSYVFAFAPIYGFIDRHLKKEGVQK